MASKYDKTAQDILLGFQTRLQGVGNSLGDEISDIISSTDSALLKTVVNKMPSAKGDIKKQMRELEKLVKEIEKIRAEGFDLAEIKAFAYGNEIVKQAGSTVAQLADNRGKIFKKELNDKQIDEVLHYSPIDGQSIAQWFHAMKTSDMERITQAVQRASVEGMSISNVVKTIRGTKENDYKDGVLETTRQSAAMTARTIVNGVASNAMLETCAENADVIDGIKFVATLDAKTCPFCGSYDGKVWKPDEAAQVKRPPLHPNCRCTVIPYIDMGPELEGERPAANADFDKLAEEAYNKQAKEKGLKRRYEDLSPSTRLKYYYQAQKDYTKKTGKPAYRQVKGDMTFKDYFDNQDAAFQKAWLGPKRYALYQQGKYNPLQLGNPDTGYVVPLKELQTVAESRVATPNPTPENNAVQVPDWYEVKDVYDDAEDMLKFHEKHKDHDIDTSLLNELYSFLPQINAITNNPSLYEKSDVVIATNWQTNINTLKNKAEQLRNDATQSKTTTLKKVGQKVKTSPVDFAYLGQLAQKNFDMMYEHVNKKDPNFDETLINEYVGYIPKLEAIIANPDGYTKEVVNNADSYLQTIKYFQGTLKAFKEQLSPEPEEQSNAQNVNKLTAPSWAEVEQTYYDAMTLLHLDINKVEQNQYDSMLQKVSNYLSAIQDITDNPDNYDVDDVVSAKQWKSVLTNTQNKLESIIHKKQSSPEPDTQSEPENKSPIDWNYLANLASNAHDMLDEHILTNDINIDESMANEFIGYLPLLKEIYTNPDDYSEDDETKASQFYFSISVFQKNLKEFKDNYKATDNQTSAPSSTGTDIEYDFGDIGFAIEEAQVMVAQHIQDDNPNVSESVLGECYAYIPSLQEVIDNADKYSDVSVLSAKGYMADIKKLQNDVEKLKQAHPEVAAANAALAPEPDTDATPANEPIAPQQRAPLKDSLTFPSDKEVEDLKTVQSLGGSTGAELVTDAKGNKWVRKYGGSSGGNQAEHVLNEVNADNFYRAMGINVPECKIRHTESGDPVKLAHYIENGQQLSQWWSKASDAQRDKMRKKLKEGLAADILTGNWDVIGLGADNILVDENGEPWRIDNGGALGFRAQGAKKSAEEWSEGFPDELWTMTGRGAAIGNNTTNKITDYIPDINLLDIVNNINNTDWESAIQTLPKEDQDVVRKRLQHVKRLADRGNHFVEYGFTKDYANQILDHSYVLTKQKLTDVLPDKIDEQSPSSLGGFRDVRSAAIPQGWEDTHNKIVAAAKTVNYHILYGNTNYNQAVLNDCYALKPQLEKDAKKGDKTAQYYLDKITAVEHGANNNSKIDTIEGPNAGKTPKGNPFWKAMENYVNSSPLSRNSEPSYNIIKDWAEAQAGDSYDSTACDFKMFELHSMGIDVTDTSQSVDDVINKLREIGYYVGDKNGDDTQQDQERAIRNSIQKMRRDKDFFTKGCDAHARYQAGIMLALEKTTFMGDDKATYTAVLERTEKADIPVLDKYGKGGKVIGTIGQMKEGTQLKHRMGINESYSQSNIYCYRGHELTMTRVPYCRINGFWFTYRSNGAPMFHGDGEKEFSVNAVGLKTYLVKHHVYDKKVLTTELNDFYAIEKLHKSKN